MRKGKTALSKGKKYDLRINLVAAEDRKFDGDRKAPVER
jgi:hypothetical protein